MAQSIPNLGDIEDAAKRISGVASRTPLVESPQLSKLAGREVYLKLECFQPIRVFKIRGAYNKVTRVKEGSVVAASSGNHGIAVAYSSRLVGKKCTVVVPETAIREKVEAIQQYGAEVVRFGKLSVEREGKARELAERSGSAFIHPYNDPMVIAGQGTCGLEICEQLEDFDSILVPVGGGGLISGISIAVKSIRPAVKVIGVEPDGAPKLSLAMKEKKIVTLTSAASVADGLLPSSLGKLTFEACSRHVDGSITVSDSQILEASRVMMKVAGYIAEPSGAAALAPLLDQAGAVPGKRTVVVVSGGNISHSLLAQLLIA